jgi:DNA polymerase-3 subunit chi
MTRVDFYVVPSSEPRQRQLLACRLTEKAYRQGLKVYLKVASEEEEALMDDLLWSFRAASFIPHAIFSTEIDPDIPVWLGRADGPDDISDVLINLSNGIPANHDRYGRIVEIVDQNEALKRISRQRYRHYKERGLELFTHTLDSADA